MADMFDTGGNGEKPQVFVWFEGRIWEADERSSLSNMHCALTG